MVLVHPHSIIPKIIHITDLHHLCQSFITRICKLIDFGQDWLRMDQGLPYTYEGQFLHPTYSTLFTIVNISDKPGLMVYT